MQGALRVECSLRKDDQVQVIAGRDKGKVGKILNVDAKAGRVVVEKVNLVKRHLRASQQNLQGGIVEKELSLHSSNVLLLCLKCNQGRRHSVRVIDSNAENGKSKRVKLRACKKCGDTLGASA